MSIVVPVRTLRTNKKFDGISYFKEGIAQAIDRNFKNFNNKNELGNAYNPDQMPPSFENCQTHIKATQIGPERPIYLDDEDENLNDQDYCICCARRTDRIQLPINCDLKSLAYIGSGYPLYFSFIKFCSLILILILLISGVFNIFTNYYYGEDCISEEEITDITKQCEKTWFTILSIGNIKSQTFIIQIQDYLDITVILVTIICLQFFRRFIKDMEQQCDELDISAKDYTIQIKNIPIQFLAFNNNYEEDIQKFFDEQIFIDDLHIYRVQNVNFVYKMDNINNLTKKKQNLLQEKANILQFQHDNGYFKPGKTVAIINKEIQDLQIEIDKMLNIYYEGRGTEFMADNFTGQAFVSFNYQQGKNIVLEKYGSKKIFKGKKQQLEYHGSKIKIYDAPNPLDVYWKNLLIKSQFIRSFISYFIILCITGSAYFVIKYYRQNHEQDLQNFWKDNSLYQFFIAFITSFIIQAYNILILICGKKLQFYVRNVTKTAYNDGAMSKVALGQFIVTTLIIYMMDIIFVDDDINTYGQAFKKRGLAYQATFIIIGNTIIPFLIEILNLKAIPRKFLQWYTLRKIKKNQPVLRTQNNLNKLFENMNFDVIYRYSTITKTLYVSAFYAYLVPMTLIVGLISLCLSYWTDKFNLLRRRSVLSNMSGQIAHRMVEMVEICLILFSLGSFTAQVYQLDYLDRNNFYKCTSFYGVCITIIHYLCPTRKLNDKIFSQNIMHMNEENFEDAKLNFLTDYQRENPATGEASKQLYMKKMHQINKEQQNKQTILKPLPTKFIDTEFGTDTRDKSKTFQVVVKQQSTIVEENTPANRKKARTKVQSKIERKGKKAQGLNHFKQNNDFNISPDNSSVGGGDNSRLLYRSNTNDSLNSNGNENGKPKKKDLISKFLQQILDQEIEKNNQK